MIPNNLTMYQLNLMCNCLTVVTCAITCNNVCNSGITRGSLILPNMKMKQ